MSLPSRHLKQRFYHFDVAVGYMVKGYVPKNAIFRNTNFCSLMRVFVKDFDDVGFVRPVFIFVRPRLLSRLGHAVLLGKNSPPAGFAFLVICLFLALLKHLLGTIFYFF